MKYEFYDNIFMIQPDSLPGILLKRFFWNEFQGLQSCGMPWLPRSRNKASSKITEVWGEKQQLYFHSQKVESYIIVHRVYD